MFSRVSQLLYLRVITRQDVTVPSNPAVLTHVSTCVSMWFLMYTSTYSIVLYICRCLVARTAIGYHKWSCLSSYILLSHQYYQPDAFVTQYGIYKVLYGVIIRGLLPWWGSQIWGAHWLPSTMPSCMKTTQFFGEFNMLVNMLAFEYQVSSSSELLESLLTKCFSSFQL
jgi:hypothetical protein